MPRTAPANPSLEARALIAVLVEATDRAGLHQEDVARAIDKRQQYVSSVYRFKTEVKGSDLFKWADLLGVPLSEVMRRAEERSRRSADVIPLGRGAHLVGRAGEARAGG